MERTKLKRIVEAFLFVSVEPVDMAQIKKASSVDDAAFIKELIDELKAEYAASDRSLRIEEMAGGFRMTTDPQYAAYIRRLLKGSQKDRISRASLETLAIVAYKQPVTRGEIEAIRGVNVDRSLSTLVERGLVRIVGRRDTAGRPMLYGTTRLFLDHFGLRTLSDLPGLEEFVISDLTDEEREYIKERYGEDGERGVQEAEQSSGKETGTGEESSDGAQKTTQSN